MAQERFRLCTDILQQQSVEARIFLAYTGDLRIVLPHFQRYLLFQRPEGCGGRSSAPEEVQAPDSFWCRIHQRRLRDDVPVYHRFLAVDTVHLQR